MSWKKLRSNHIDDTLSIFRDGRFTDAQLWNQIQMLPGLQGSLSQLMRQLSSLSSTPIGKPLTSKSGVQWLTLPDPLYDLVFALLEPVELFEIVENVCRHWKSLSCNGNGWYSLNVRDFALPTTSMVINRLGTRIQHHRIHHIEITLQPNLGFIPYWWRQLYSLTILIPAGSESWINNHSSLMALGNLSSLSILSLIMSNQTTKREIIVTLPDMIANHALKHLILEHEGRGKVGVEIPKLLLSRLKILEIHKCLIDIIGPESDTPIFPLLSRCSILHIMVSSVLWRALCEAPLLTSLTSTFPQHQWPQDETPFARCWPSELQYLQLYYTISDDSKIVESLWQQCPDLIHLDLSNTKCATRDSSIISKFVNLRSLVFPLTREKCFWKKIMCILTKNGKLTWVNGVNINDPFGLKVTGSVIVARYQSTLQTTNRNTHHKNYICTEPADFDINSFFVND